MVRVARRASETDPSADDVTVAVAAVEAGLLVRDPDDDTCARVRRARNCLDSLDPAFPLVLPADPGEAPVESGLVPAHTAALPAHTAALPAHTAVLPAHTAALPAHTAALRAHTAALPAHTAAAATGAPSPAFVDATGRSHGSAERPCAACGIRRQSRSGAEDTDGVKRSLWVGCVLSSVILAACDGGGTSGSSTSAPPELAPALGAFCDLITRCPDDLYPVGARDRNECIDILYWLFTCRRVDGGVQRIELSLDATTASQCADALSTLTCDRLTCVSDGSCPELDACRPLFAGFDDGGSSDDEGSCEPADGTCGAGTYCGPERYDADLGAVVCRTCEPLAADGDECDYFRPDKQCADGLLCVRSSETGMGVCSAPLPDGESCERAIECQSGFCANAVCSSDGYEGDPCDFSNQCRGELGCVGGTCGPLLANGEPCSTSDECELDVCDTDGRCGLALGSSCNGQGHATCRSGFCDGYDGCGTPRANGETCSFDEGCTSGYCDPGAGTCAPAPAPGGIGAACTDARQCEEGLACSSVCYAPCGEDGSCPDGQYCDFSGYPLGCIAMQSAGGACERDEQCTTGFCSDAGVCGERPGIGDACLAASDCYPRGYCDGGVCAARKEPGESCDALDSCLEPYLCLNSVCTRISLACEPAPAGQPCTFLRFCDASSYCDVTSFTCVARKSEGDACIGYPDEECGVGFYCGARSGTPTCLARAADGAACDESTPCVEGTFCVGGSCRAGAGGNPCEGDDDSAEGTFCNSRSDVCEPLRALGDECDEYDAPCEHGLYCDFGSQTCVASPGAGEPCDSDSGCAGGAVCGSDGTCVAQVGLGEECMEVSYGVTTCAEGLYCNTSTTPAVCVTALANGERCTRAEECASGYCVNGWCSSHEYCISR